MPILQRRDRPLLLIPPIIIFLDILIKRFILGMFNYQPYPDSSPIPVFNDVLHLTYVQNYGFFFKALGEANRYLLPYVVAGVFFITLLVIVYFFANTARLFTRPARLPAKACLMVILGGDISNNIFDRFTHGFVIDYLNFGIGANRFYTFNFADLCIIGGALILAVLILFYENKNA